MELLWYLFVFWYCPSSVCTKVLFGLDIRTATMVGRRWICLLSVISMYLSQIKISNIYIILSVMSIKSRCTFLDASSGSVKRTLFMLQLCTATTNLPPDTEIDLAHKWPVSCTSQPTFFTNGENAKIYHNSCSVYWVWWEVTQWHIGGITLTPVRAAGGWPLEWKLKYPLTMQPAGSWSVITQEEDTSICHTARQDK